MKGVNRLAISQAAPLRRLHLKGELQIFDWASKGNVGYSSGGLHAYSVVDGKVVPGSQQWLTRNSTWGGWQNRENDRHQSAVNAGRDTGDASDPVGTIAGQQGPMFVNVGKATA